MRAQAIDPKIMAKLAVLNRSAWSDFIAGLYKRREELIKALLSHTEYGDLRMLQGRLAETDALIAAAESAVQHLEGA